jgi:hypothetical protein
MTFLFMEVHIYYVDLFFDIFLKYVEEDILKTFK